MSLDDIQLNGYLTELLFGHCLIDLTPVSEKKGQETSDDEDKILILTDRSGKDEIDATASLLTAILQSCQIDLSKIKLWNADDIKEHPIEKLLVSGQPQKIIIFGTIPGGIFKETEVTDIPIIQEGEKTILNAPPLGQLAENKTLKLKLWNQLRVLFDISP